MGGLGSHHPWSISCCLWGSVPPQLSYKEVCLFLLSSVYEVKTCFVLFFLFLPLTFVSSQASSDRVSSILPGSIISSAFWGLFLFYCKQQQQPEQSRLVQ